MVVTYSLSSVVPIVDSHHKTIAYNVWELITWDGATTGITFPGDAKLRATLSTILGGKCFRVKQVQIESNDAFANEVEICQYNPAGNIHGYSEGDILDPYTGGTANPTLVFEPNWMIDFNFLPIVDGAGLCLIRTLTAPTNTKAWMMRMTLEVL